MESQVSNPICCICGRTCESPYGNNPWPIKDKGVCCDECNYEVILARFARMGEQR